MGIDIDSFLDKFDVGETENKKDNGENILNKLNFQKDVEDNLVKVEKKAMSSEFDVLKNIYTEVRSFDSDLVSKFSDIGSSGKLVLKNLGDKYSTNFLNAISNNVSIIQKELDLSFSKLNIAVDSNDFNSSFKLFSEILIKLNNFPQEFLLNKIDFFNKIKLIEIRIFENMNKYKQKDLILLKSEIKELILKLNSILKIDNTLKIREIIEKLNEALRKIPIIFTSELSFERIAAAKVIMKSENFLKNEYQENFKIKRSLIVNLFSKFQTASINRDPDLAIMIYDEILEEFNLLPDVFLKEKMDIFKEVNIMYGSINELMLKNKVTMFLEGYNYSKIFDEVRDHLTHIKRVGRVEITTILSLKSKLISIPNKFSIQRDELLLTINLFLNRFEEKKNNIKSESIEENKYEKIQIKKTLNFSEVKEVKIKSDKEKLDEKRKEFEDKMSFTEKNLDKFNPINSENILEKYIEDNKKKMNTDSKINIKSNLKKIEIEVDKYFKIIKNSNDISRVKIAYKKVLFYIDLLNISNNKKKFMKNKVKELLKTKKFT